MHRTNVNGLNGAKTLDNILPRPGKTNSRRKLSTLDLLIKVLEASTKRKRGKRDGSIYNIRIEIIT